MQNQNQYKSGIYQIRHIDSNKCYIGSAVDFAERWRLHQLQLNSQKHHSRYLQRAWSKYNSCAFVFEVLLYCDPENCLFYEQMFLDYYQPIYNCSPTAGGTFGLRWSKASKQKHSQSRIGKHNPNWGNKHSIEAKAKMSKVNRGSKHHSSKLTEDDVLQIRELLKQRLTHAAIGKQFGVARQTITNISTGHRWKVYDV